MKRFFIEFLQNTPTFNANDADHKIFDSPGPVTRQIIFNALKSMQDLSVKYSQMTHPLSMRERFIDEPSVRL